MPTTRGKKAATRHWMQSATPVFSRSFWKIHPEDVWAAAAIEKNEFVDGIDHGNDIQRYPIMLSRVDGGLAWSYQDEFGNVEYED